uniref:Uncharacterized protein n=1 Tax=Tetranychus urticae TaxID=32264 RepID=T1K9N6_TETUR
MVKIKKTSKLLLYTVRVRYCQS